MTGTPARTLVIDEGLDSRLAAELERRGRRAVSVSALGLLGSSDPELLRALDAQVADWVLVTADEHLPLEHAAALAAVTATVATIEPERDPAAWPLAAYRREVVHRWAHAMHAQPRGSRRRYGLTRRGSWRARLG